MKKLCPKFISLFFAGILFSAAIGLSLCLHENGRLHVTPAKAQGCPNGVGEEWIVPAGHTCVDFGFDFKSEFVASANTVSAAAVFAALDTFEVRVPAAPVAKYEAFYVTTAPPDVVLGALYDNITARLLI